MLTITCTPTQHLRNVRKLSLRWMGRSYWLGEEEPSTYCLLYMEGQVTSYGDLLTVWRFQGGKLYTT